MAVTFAKYPSPRLLKLDDVRWLDAPGKVADTLRILGYEAGVQTLDPVSLELSERHTQAILAAYLLADQAAGGMQVLLFELDPRSFSSAGVVSGLMRGIPQALAKLPSHYFIFPKSPFPQWIPTREEQ